tara:strand:- start:126 stop:956 length:831 start_codon:yes stop_codon:yes gene_type:complete
MRIVEDFNNTEDFFNWYVPKIEEFVPNLKAYVLSDRHADIARQIPKISKEYVQFMFNRIREIINVPDNVKLVYDSGMYTWASTYNTMRKRLEIIVPPYAQYQIYYPPIIKAAIQHEMGHIINRDYTVATKGKDSNAVNICMDCRINANINRDWLSDLTNATYKFLYKKGFDIVPEHFYPQIGMPYNGKVHGWKQIYHFWKMHQKTLPPSEEPKTKKPDSKKIYEQPKVGDIVQISSGDNEGDLGMVLDVDENGKCDILPMTIAQVDAHFEGLSAGG